MWNTGFNNIAPLQSTQRSGFSLPPICFPFQGSIPSLGFFHLINALLHHHHLSKNIMHLQTYK